jgi:predicted SPOUT superfamily RNA methylase MTH1
MNSNTHPLRLSIAIPSSFIDTYPNKAQKTQQIGRIGRAAAIFQVSEILVYQDKKTPAQRKNSQLITRVLEYLETPQYLRKHLFGKLPELRFAGLLPPLRTPHHPIEKRLRNLNHGEFREGYAYLKGQRPVVDVGVEVPLPLIQEEEKLPTRITVQIHRDRDGVLAAHPFSHSDPPAYWGYKTRQIQLSLADFLYKSTRYKLIVAATRKGDLVNEQVSSLYQSWQKTGHLLLLFGSHEEGLDAIFRRMGQDLSSIAQYQVNFLLDQGVATIRVEEAILIGLTTFRFLERGPTVS